MKGTKDDIVYYLPNALVYRDGEGTITPLSTAPLTIYRPAEANEHTDITWSGDAGLWLNSVPGAAQADVNYTTTIEWTLVDGI